MNQSQLGQQENSNFRKITTCSSKKIIFLKELYVAKVLEKILHVASRKVEVVIQNYCIVVILTLFTSFTYCVRYVTSFPGAPFGSTVSTDSDQ